MIPNTVLLRNHQSSIVWRWSQSRHPLNVGDLYEIETMDILFQKELALTYLYNISLWWRSIFGLQFFVTSTDWISPTNGEKYIFHLLSFINRWAFSPHYLLDMSCDVYHQVVSHRTSLVTWSIGTWPCAGSHPVTRFYDPLSPKSTNRSQYLPQSSLTLVRVL